jgi:type I restriction enzyme S subunit
MTGKSIPLNEFITLQRGHDLPNKDRIEGDIPVVASTGIAGYHNEAKAKAPGVVIGRSGSIGGGQYVTEDFWPLNTTLWVKDFKGHNERFIYYLLKSIDFSLFNVGSGVPTLNRNHLSSILIDDKGRQSEDRIAKILGDIDDKVELNMQENQTLEEIAQALFKSWFVDFDPVRAKIETLAAGGSQADAELAAMSVISAKTPEELKSLKESSPEAYTKLRDTAALFPSAMKESELGSIPEGWNFSEIGNEVTVVGGGTPSTKNSEFWDGGNIHWTTPKDMSGLASKVLINTERKITESGLKKISSGLLPENTVLMSSRAPVGYLALAKIPLAVNQGYIAMKCESRLSPEYVLFWCNQNMDEIKQRASGTTFAEISKANFKPIPVIVPMKHVLDVFTSHVSVLYDSVHRNLLESESLSSMRDMLIPALLGGSLSELFREGE